MLASGCGGWGLSSASNFLSPLAEHPSYSLHCLSLHCSISCSGALRQRQSGDCSPSLYHLLCSTVTGCSVSCHASCCGQSGDAVTAMKTTQGCLFPHHSDLQWIQCQPPTHYFAAIKILKFSHVCLPLLSHWSQDRQDDAVPITTFIVSTEVPNFVVRDPVSC